LELAAHVRRVGPWAQAIATAAPETDIFQTQALIALPAVARAARKLGGRYVYDVADYQTEAARMARLPPQARDLLKRRERRLAREAAGLLAVSEPMANLVAEQFGIPKPPVLMNCQPAWRPAEPEPPVSTLLRDRLGLAPNRPIVLHHGQFKLDRGIEELVKAADHPALRAFDPAIAFMGYGRMEPYLQAAAARLPERLFVLPAMPPEELIEWVAGADVAYLGCPPRTLNLKLTISNKVFEAMMAGVPAVAAIGTEQGRLVAAEGVGRSVNVDSTDDLAAAIASILALPEGERLALRRRCRSIALNKYTWEQQASVLIDLYRRL
jgi:glycosyltransferase involved in cell wall biosynthesis